MTATNKSRKLVLAATVVGLALMLGASMIYRMANPSLTVTPRGGMQTMPQGATPQGFPENMPPEMAKALQESGKMPGGMSGAGAMSGASSAPTGGMPGANNMETVMQRMQSDPQAMAAMQQLMQQLKETPNDPKTLLGVAEQFMRMGAWERAETFLNRALVADPSNAAAMYMLGVARFESKDYLTARDRFADVLALEPENPEARFNLGILYKHYLNKADEADKLFTAVRDAKDTPQDLRDMASKELGTEPAKK